MVSGNNCWEINKQTEEQWRRNNEKNVKNEWTLEDKAVFKYRPLIKHLDRHLRVTQMPQDFLSKYWLQSTKPDISSGLPGASKTLLSLDMREDGRVANKEDSMHCVSK